MTTFLLKDLTHLKSHQDENIYLVDCVLDRPFLPSYLARIAHENVNVSLGVHFVNSVLFAKTVKLSKNTV